MMGAPDCATCESMGYRICDECGGIVFQGGFRSPLGFDLCEGCATDFAVLSKRASNR